MLIALRMKGETAEEMIGAAHALSAAALPFERPDYLFADCCGTGGDGSGLINVSTATGFVAAACGLPIAKHGNRSVSSQCGSADVLGSGRRQDRRFARQGPRDARRDRLLLPVRPRLPPGDEACRAGPPPIVGADGDEFAWAVHQSGATAGAIARRGRPEDAPPHRPDARRDRCARGAGGPWLGARRGRASRRDPRDPPVGRRDDRDRDRRPRMPGSSARH